MADRPRIAVVSPFLDKRHGTERCVAEQVERLAYNYGYDVHIYSQRVEDIEGLCDMKSGLQSEEAEPCKQGDEMTIGNGEKGIGLRVPAPGRIVWHRVPDIPGPYLVRYIWWFISNHLRRWWDTRIRGLCYDLIYSPGINCLDADVIVVYHVFSEFYNRIKDGLRLIKKPVTSWPWLIHRHLYYRLIIALERRIYHNPRLTLGSLSSTVSSLVYLHFKKTSCVIYPGVDSAVFNPETRYSRRAEARARFGISNNQFALLIIGNDWHEKGLSCLLEAMGLLKDLSLLLLVRGRDERAPYERAIEKLGLTGMVRFLDRLPDVVQFYAAADLYVGPSLYDSFAIPVAEAMACGLPVIASIQAGVSEIVTDGENGFILRDPKDVEGLAEKIRLLYEDTDMCSRLGQKAAQTISQFTWERNALQIQTLLGKALSQKQQVCGWLKERMG